MSNKNSTGNQEETDKSPLQGLKATLAGCWDTVQTVIYAVLIALVVRTFAYEPFNIPSGSMVPTLLVGDYLFVSKFSYGYSRYSLPFSLPLISGRFMASAPERGDVAVFRPPGNESVDFIKRVIGLPGDRIQVREGILHINDVAVKREPVDVITETVSLSSARRPMEFIETLPNGRQHLIREYSDVARMDNTEVYTVPEGHFFMMGDNRDNSHDSRVIGPVPLENMVGRAEILFFSTNGEADWWQIWGWFGATRFNRLFSVID